MNLLARCTAMTSSAGCDPVFEPLLVSEQELDTHSKSVKRILQTVVRPESGKGIQFVTIQDLDPKVYGLAGKDCERAFRNRGSDAFVAPMFDFGDGLWVWLGYQEEWNREPTKGRQKRFSFESLGLTFHFGQEGNPSKSQMFRAEWMRQSDQTGKTANPHWHFDALETLVNKDMDRRRVDDLLMVLKEDDESVPREFIPQNPVRVHEDVRGNVGLPKLSRMHFASAAAWWREPKEDAHAHAPGSTAEIRAWLRKVLSYLRRELSMLGGSDLS